MIRIGFTGSRNGFTRPQAAALSLWLEKGLINVIDDCLCFHGACVGADERFVDLVRVHHEPAVIHAYPSNLAGLTSRRAVAMSDVVHEPAPPLDRNRVIVDSCDVLLACPDGMQEVQRSGTWATVRFARKVGRTIVIFFPDGTTQ